MHPQWQKLAREEVLRVCGARDIPSKDDFSKLKTVRYLLFYLFVFTGGLLNYQNNPKKFGKKKEKKGKSIFFLKTM